MKYFNPTQLKRIEAKKKQLNQYRPLSPALVKKLREEFNLLMTYNSNAIEGNSLTLKETFLVIKEGLTVKGKPLKDHLETKNHYEAIDYLYSIIDKKNVIKPSEKLIKEIHYLITSDTLKREAGKYRVTNVIISGSKHKPPLPTEISELMNKLILFWRKNEKKIHPIELAALVHHQLVFIHPFTDGNGRVARTIMNLILMQKGYPLAVILKNDRKKYYQYLSLADKGNVAPFINFAASAVERSLDMYLNIISSSKIEWQPLSVLAKKFHFTQKHLNFLSRTGKLDAHKEGRIWVSTEENIKSYLASRLRKNKNT